MSQEALAVTVAAAAAGISYTHEVGERARRARESADDANDKADSALEGVERLAGSGAVVRGDDSSVADFEVGLSIPQQTAASRVGVFATTPQPLTRPIVSEDDAADVAAYPGTVSKYTRSGLLTDTQNAKGQNVLVGVALRFVELRAFLLGLLSMTGNGQNPAKEVIRQFFRFAQGIARALVERVTVSEPDGMTQDSYTDAIRRLLSGVASGVRKIAQLTPNTSGVSVSGGTGEVSAFSLIVPAGTLAKDGDETVIRAGGIRNGVNAADTSTVRIRLGSATGPVLAGAGPNNVLSASFWQEVRMTRVGPNQVRISSLGGWDAAANTIGSVLATMDFQAAVAIHWTVQHSTNSASNITQIDTACIWTGPN